MMISCLKRQKGGYRQAGIVYIAVLTDYVTEAIRISRVAGQGYQDQDSAVV